MRNNAAYLPESPIVYIILPKSIRNRASFRIFVPMLEKNEIIQSALQNLKIESLNPMQEAALEQGTGRKDVILLSPTGSGKTLAYLLPLLLILKPNDAACRC